MHVHGHPLLVCNVCVCVRACVRACVRVQWNRQSAISLLSTLSNPQLDTLNQFSSTATRNGIFTRCSLLLHVHGPWAERCTLELSGIDIEVLRGVSLRPLSF